MDSLDKASSTAFTIDNIPFGVISTPDNPTPRCATAFEDQAVDLSGLENDGVFASIVDFGTGVFSQCSEVIGLEVNPNWYCIPSCYNGRTSSLRISGEPIRRPWGVIQPSEPGSSAAWAPSRRLDFELEMGIYVSKPLPPGQILDIRQARDHIFGFVLLNDWSARDIQGFEMSPLGPFHSKGFGTTDLAVGGHHGGPGAGRV
ncbi:uncharacterized protein LDX57_010041 [Aspergillus melleus]|uniref:uncharacterized protein n=1 Tax=Aspergillus melleus TaxID=138277 RepID=UPI001E8CD0D0|nr:uncharacterized protein LDX57_010041 [Aspergillus melleus]KAH8432402.1 hypothetical protein LDX57_010041 [Aspergillus melleus]